MVIPIISIILFYDPIVIKPLIQSTSYPDHKCDHKIHSWSHSHFLQVSTADKKYTTPVRLKSDLSCQPDQPFVKWCDIFCCSNIKEGWPRLWNLFLCLTHINITYHIVEKTMTWRFYCVLCRYKSYYVVKHYFYCFIIANRQAKAHSINIRKLCSP